MEINLEWAVLPTHTPFMLAVSLLVVVDPFLRFEPREWIGKIVVEYVPNASLLVVVEYVPNASQMHLRGLRNRLQSRVSSASVQILRAQPTHDEWNAGKFCDFISFLEERKEYVIWIRLNEKQEHQSMYL